ncbi:MAG: F0F1 ATP synthase subunit A [Actinomycetota bacterium]
MTSLHHLHALVQATGTITVGEHAREWHLFGMTINADTVWGTLIVAAIVCALTFAATRKATSGVPGKGQLMYEMIVEQVQGITDSAIGPKGRKYVPIGITLFLFILLCNWISIIPSGHNPEWLPSPTGDIREI